MKIACCLVSTFVLGSVPQLCFAQVQTTPTPEEDWRYKAIEQLSNSGVIEGTKHFSYMGSANIGDRSTFAAGEKSALIWLSREIKKSPPKFSSNTGDFVYNVTWQTNTKEQRFTVSLNYSAHAKQLLMVMSAGGKPVLKQWKPLYPQQIHRVASRRGSLRSLGKSKSVTLDDLSK